MCFLAKMDQKYLVSNNIAKPVHIQRLEKCLDLGPFLNYVEKKLHVPVNDDDSSCSDDESLQNVEDNLSFNNVDLLDKSKHFNFSSLSHDRKWLQDILLDTTDSDDSAMSDEITEESLTIMLKNHIKMKKFSKKFYNDKDNAQYQYYSAGLLSNYDKYPEHRKSTVTLKKSRRDREKDYKSDKKCSKSSSNRHRSSMKDATDESYLNYNVWDGPLMNSRDGLYNASDDMAERKPRHSASSGGVMGRLAKRHAKRSPELMTARRRKVWTLMCKKEIGKVQRAKVTNHKELLASCKKAAQLCMRHCRQKASHSQKNMKETLWRSKRLTREMQSYWKRYDRVERETRKRMEKEAEEQRKMDVEMIEAKRQQRKLNFLITQTELYAHFMSRKLKKSSPGEQLIILSQLDEEKNPRLASIDDYDSEAMKAKAKKNARDAFNNERARTKQFDVQCKANSGFMNDMDDEFQPAVTNEEHPQPSLFKGKLKGYQLRGMNWLANLYDQGISGILADEMGLGKTVQSIAFLCHVAERYSVWGPFLIISPASTLHNWQQEMERFVPSFKVVPYWGNPNERKILRQFWDQKDMHTKDASFHVVITSYQIVITDFKYFNRIKWQYMILDEAQAIKSTSSVRWKMLLGFSCRNRLLLSGTPIQNSMAELWALLHFIMPTLFDSHDEFNEWFSKDIENHAENKTGIDEKHLSRLHMILKPFMLRRIKKDVENELSDKIEIMVYCPLTTRQKLLYMALKKKIRIEDLLHYTTSGSSESHSLDKNFTSNLMNLVMQFRKVCNHPELFERRDAKSSFHMEVPYYHVPKLFQTSGMTQQKLLTKDYIIERLLSIFDKKYILDSLGSNSNDSIFIYMKYLNLSVNEMHSIAQDWVYRCKHFFKTLLLLNILHIQRFWNKYHNSKYMLLLNDLLPMSYPKIQNSEHLQALVFTSYSESCSTIYTHTNHVHHVMPETVEHKLIRTKTGSKQDDCNDSEQSKLIKPNLQPRSWSCQRTRMSSFLFKVLPKVQCMQRSMYCNDRSAQWDLLKYNQVGSWHGVEAIWSRVMDVEANFSQPLFINQGSSGVALRAAAPIRSWSNILVPDKETLVTDAGKLSVLDSLLTRLKKEGHRVLIYSQMTKMIDLLEEYMWHRKHKYMRLDGSSKISERRDMVADFQARTDIFAFLLSTRAGGLGINLTAADTVIFYDSDWNPTVDQQAMDRAHRLGQTKQVTVYRLICKGTIEERILQRAREKSEIQRMVISGGNFKPDTLKPKEVVSLLLDDDEIEMKYKQKTEERRHADELREARERERERKRKQSMNIIKARNSGVAGSALDVKRSKGPDSESGIDEVWLNVESNPQSPANSDSEGSGIVSTQDDTSNEANVVDNSDQTTTSQPAQTTDCNSLSFSLPYGATNKTRIGGVRGYSKRGRPRGSRRTSSYLRPVSLSQHSGQSTLSDSGLEASTSASTLFDSQNSSQSPRGESPVPVRRGPGRPRLKPGGPCNQGGRGVSRPRKPARPLPVPIRSGTSSASINNATNPTESGNNFCFYESNPDVE